MNLQGTLAGSAVEVVLDTTWLEEIAEEAIAGTVMAGVETRVVVEGVELVTVTNDTEVGRLEEVAAATAASRLEAW